MTEGAMAISESNSSVVDSFRKQLRQRPELASVLHFLQVFELLIGKASKVSAEELEAALVEPNATLAQLHITLLQGITTMSKTKDSDAWIVTLSKTLVNWWPWVAEGEFPLSGVSKGEEISFYKGLDPIARLIILKALCEVRADQYDVGSYINDAVKNGTEVSAFRKDKLAGDGEGVSFWYDGNETIGYRLYKEVDLFGNERIKRKGTSPELNCQWETLATNLEEFNKIVTEFSSSKVELEIAVSKSVEADVIPVLQKHLKKKEMAQRRKQREQMLLNSFRSSAITRSCRNQKPVNYRFDDYDRAITEAIQYTNKRRTTEEEGHETKQRKTKLTASHESSSSDNDSIDGELTDANLQEIDDSEDSSDEKKETKAEIVNQHQNVRKNSRFSKRLAGIPGHTVSESMDLGAKKRLRQRPCLNSAVESTVVPDSEDEKSSGDAN